MSADGSQIIRLPLAGKTIRAADLFCGAGGTSTGAMRAIRELGGKMRLTGVNHWPVAIETHTRNHPDAIHICADLERVRPREVIPDGVLDLLMASPTCTYYSRARGGRPVHDQQRMDPWHVVRWCTELRVHRLLVENVPEMMDWGPCDIRTGRPMASRKGEYFRAWIDALKGIGIRLDYRVLRCADYGDATTRDRLFIIGRSDRKALRWPEPTHVKGGRTDLFGSRIAWRPAREIIDWGIQGKSIFTRKRPLKPNTIRRILAGARRYRWPTPHIAALEALLDGRAPVLNLHASSAAPFLIKFRGTESTHIESGAQDLSEPLPTVSAGGRHQALVMATGAGGVARDTNQPIPTVTAGGDGGARPHLIEPLIVSKHGGPSNSARGVDEPAYAVDTGGGGGIAQPLVGEAPGQEPRTHSIDDPTPAITATGHIQVAEPVSTGYRIDILYRMLHWRELSRAMSFDDEGEVYDFAGTATDITKQIGNAVPGRTAKALVRALMEG